MGLLQRIKQYFAPEQRSINGEHLWYGPPTTAGVHVTHHNALEHPPLFAAFNIISGDVAGLPLHTYERLPDGGREVACDHATYDLVHADPNEDMDGFTFRQTLTTHAMQFGGGFGFIIREGDGTATGFDVLDPTKVEIIRHNGRKYFKIEGWEDPLPQEYVLHIHGLGPDGQSGYSLVDLFRQSLGLGIATERFGAAFFGNGLNAKGFIKVTEGRKLKPEDTQAIREVIEAVHGGPSNAHKPAILQPNWEWVPTSVTPNEAQFLETRNFQIDEVARICRIHPLKLGSLNHATFGNVEEANLDHYQSCLMPWIRIWESELTRKLFYGEEKGRYFVEHNMGASLRGRANDRKDFYVSMSGIGVLSVNDIRKMENLNPIKGGDLHPFPLNFTTVEALAMEPEPQATSEPIDPAKLLEILNAVVAGTLPIGAASAVISASFPTLTPAEVAAILDGVKPTQPVPVAEPEPAPTPTDPAVNAVRGWLTSETERLVRREVTNLRRILKRDDAREQVASFYAEHEVNCREALTPSLEARGSILASPVEASPILARFVAEARDAILGRLDGSPEGIEELLTSWELDRAGDLVNAFMEDR